MSKPDMSKLAQSIVKGLGETALFLRQERMPQYDCNLNNEPGD